MPSIFIHGNDTFRAKIFIDNQVEQFRKSHTNCQTNVIETKNTSLENISSLLNPLALFAETKAVVLKNPLDTKNEDIKKYITEQLLAPQDTMLLIVWSQQNVDKRTQFWKQLSKNLPKTSIEEFTALKPQQLLVWFRDYCQSKKIHIETPALQYLIDIRPNLHLIKNELDKLKLLPDQPITLAHVQKNSPIPKQIIIFNLSEELGTKQFSKAHQTLQNLLNQGESAPSLIGVIANHFIQLSQIQSRLASGTPPGQLAGDLGINPYVVQKLVSQTRNFSTSELNSVIKILANADVSIKNGQSDFEQEFSKLIFLLKK